MLANGATLEYKKKSDTSGTFTKLLGLKEIPEMGSEPEKVENTTLEDSLKQYEMGIGDAGDITYKFKYDNSSAQSPYRLMRAAQESGDVLTFKETLKDGTKVTLETLKEQVNYVKKFLPSMLSEEEVKEIIEKLDEKSMPSIMRHFKANFAGKCDMSIVSKLAKQYQG